MNVFEQNPLAGIVVVAIVACVLLFAAGVIRIFRSAKTEDEKTTHDIALEVLSGLWGNGQDRVDRLSAAGYDPTEVQAAVNRLLEERNGK